MKTSSSALNAVSAAKSADFRGAGDKVHRDRCTDRRTRSLNGGSDLATQGGAQFSHCGTYRYRLWRQWDESRRALAFIMLNPSTADERRNDPTIARCLARAVASGFGRLEVVNLYPLRATDPNELLKHPDPLGPKSLADAAIVDALDHTDIAVCAWGAHPAAVYRAAEVLGMLAAAQRSGRLYHLGLNRDGSPRHPLYIAASVRLRHFLPKE